MRRPAGDRHAGDGHLRKKIIDALPYALTASQRQAAVAITDDLRQPVRMLRLLQGDVGSGKTVVALLAAAAVTEAGKQAALMAPTEILARQHIKTIAPLAERAGLRVAILTGREKGKERRDILARLETGEIDLLVGTHALIQDDVVFKALALAVVDEQHRFGVRERLALTAKGAAVDVLVLSATPIPRTLVLTYFGDMDVSELREKPAGRQPVDTRAVPDSRLSEVMDAVGRALSAGKLVYWICPLVEESEAIDLTDAEQRFQSLKARFDDKVGLVHGKMRGTEKDRVMAQFAAGELGLLVATTVVEVGVDVPAATIMVIENAERFGLAQLHQLRGRIGRGSESSTCLLLYREPLNEMSKARLKAIRETTDGFRIAEEDLKLRGEGDVLGVIRAGSTELGRLVPAVLDDDVLEGDVVGHDVHGIVAIERHRQGQQSEGSIVQHRTLLPPGGAPAQTAVRPGSGPARVLAEAEAEFRPDRHGFRAHRRASRAAQRRRRGIAGRRTDEFPRAP